MTNLKDGYEVIEWEGKKYYIANDAEISHSTKVRIGNTILYLEGTIYEADCIDEFGNEYRAYWVADDEAEKPEDACEWDRPEHVEMVFR